MAKDVRPRVRVPKTAKPGEVINLKTLISHPMESGQRKDADGKLIPREIINRFVVDFAGENVIDVKMEPAISTNPYFEFDVKVEKSGEFTFTWHDDDGSVYEEKQSIEVA
ncbi:thiosulfate oxidation carrier complex protein SoxZ [Paracoccus panacisoli]|uniref:Thiosulfate oxidation carrier complex protein SoxZ n=1 Tax=Paracoccus panacisoli TaxID=1510163 RepID=A0ABV6SZX2_9RHOB|nr:thiosulfate oxidation carrier complex protein SoxZ [Paracoccus sanguinis]KGJ14049.1 sulfur oxidation protein [Paracoccus sanguinis]KGJ19858.1 sulfur oxidation protein [Paracoccus sanguinis]QJD17135.1 thiosulfate oxidation carrier complex protein SoxZ [Paracoccus sanguinis]